MSQVKTIADKELMLQIVGYNAEAFKQLFNQYAPGLLALIKEIIRNPKLAEKVLLNVFSVMLKRIDHFDTSTSSVYTYLTLLTRNISLDVLKRIKSAESLPVYSSEYEIEFILPKLSIEITPIDNDQRFFYGNQIRSYKEQLTEIQNLLLSLIYFEGLTEDEIATRLNIPLVTVRQKILIIMEFLYRLYTGKTNESLSKKSMLELIKLEALGYLTAEERMQLNNLKENDPHFLWVELGEYQNLTALISSTLQEQNLPRNFDDDVMNIFTQILLQDGDVEYPKVEDEILNTEPEPIKPVEQTEPKIIETPVLPVEKPEEPIKTEKKETEFKLKFREPDPEELNIIRLIEKTKPKQKEAAAFNKTGHESAQNTVSPRAEKPDVVISRITNSPKPKETVNQLLNDDNKIKEKPDIPASAPTEKTNKDVAPPKVDQTKQIVNKTENKIVTKLTPTSSINIEEIIKNDVKNIANKGTLIENSRLNYTAQLKQNPAANKDENRAKENQQPKEIKQAVIQTEKQQPIVKSKEQETLVNKSPEIISKIVEPAKEIRKDVSTPTIVNKPNEVKSAPPIKEKTESVEIPSAKKVVDKIPAKPVEKKPVSPVTPNDKPLKTEDSTKIIEKSGEKDLKKISRQENDAASLHIREINFNDDVKNTAKTKPEPKIDDIKSVVENILKEKNLTGTVSVEEVISKLAAEKNTARNIEPEDDTESKVLFKDFSYDEEIAKINKQSRKKFFAYAAILAVLAVTGIFAYMNMQSKTVETASDTKKDSQTAKQQTENYIANIESVEITTKNPDKSAAENKDTKVDLKPIKDAEIKLPPPPEIFEKSTNNKSLNNETTNVAQQQKDDNIIAAAKTETIIPPKENKVKEEEPAFFVAVEEMPQLVGGIKTLHSKIKYPEIAKRNKIEGKVLVQALVDENGNVISATTLKGIGGGCDEVSVEAVKNSTFTPGKQRGKNVKVQVVVPIVFKIQD